MVDIDENIPLGNLDNKVVYFSVVENKLVYTYLNKDNAAIKNISSCSILGFVLLQILDNILVFDSFTLKFIAAFICFILSVEIANKSYEADNQDTDIKDFYLEEKALIELLKSWKTKALFALLILLVDMLLIFITLYSFFSQGSIYSLFFFSVCVMLFQLGNKHVIKRYKILCMLLKDKTQA